MEDDVIIEQVKEQRHLLSDIALLKFSACLAPSILSFYACQCKLHPSVARSQFGAQILPSLFCLPSTHCEVLGQEVKFSILMVFCFSYLLYHCQIHPRMHEYRWGQAWSSQNGGYLNKEGSGSNNKQRRGGCHSLILRGAWFPVYPQMYWVHTNIRRLWRTTFSWSWELIWPHIEKVA